MHLAPYFHFLYNIKDIILCDYYFIESYNSDVILSMASDEIPFIDLLLVLLPTLELIHNRNPNSKLLTGFAFSEYSYRLQCCYAVGYAFDERRRRA